MATLYWHNLTADNDATDRSNYSTDQAGTVAATAGSMAADDLRFDGTGVGAGDNWVISPAGTVEASTIDFTDHPQLVGTEDLITPANQSTIIATTITNLGAGRATNDALPLGGIMRVNAVSFSLSMGRIGGASNRITIEYTGLAPKCSVSGNGNVVYARDSFVLDDSTIEFESTASGEVQYRNGLKFAAPGGQLRKTGAGHLRHQGGRSGYANIGSIDIEAGELGIGTWDDDGNPTGFDPVDPVGVPITFSADTGLQLEASNNGIQWGLNLQIPALATGARVRFSGGPQTIAAVSTLNAQEDVTLEHPLNTRVTLSPTFSGPGELTLEYSGNGTSIYRIDTGSPISNQINVVTTGGTASRRLELSSGTEIAADLGVSVFNGPVTVEAGSKLTLTAGTTLSSLVLQGHLDLNGFGLDIPAFTLSTGTLTPNAGSITSTGTITLSGGTLSDPAGATFTCAEWLSSIPAVGTAAWVVNASVDAYHASGALAFSTATGVYGLLDGDDAGNNTNWVEGGELYWHNIGADNDGTLRTNYTWDQAGTIPARAGSMAPYALFFNGNGVGNDSAWNIGPAQTLTCFSLRVGGSSVTYTVDALASVVITDEFSVYSGGTAAAWGGALSVGRVTQVLSSFSNSANRCALTLTGNEITRNNGNPGNTSRTMAVDLILTQETTITSEGVNGNDVLNIDGTITGGEKIVKAGSRELRLSLTGNGRTSDVLSVDIIAGLLFVSQNADSGLLIQGIGGVGGEPAECPVTLAGNDTTLRYGCNNNGTVQWGNPVITAVGVTGAALLFEGTGDAAVHQILAPVTLDADLRVYRGNNISRAELVGPVGWSGLGTLAPDTGKIMGGGKLTVERPTGLAQDFFFYVLYDTGARIEHTGGTLITSPTQSYRADFGYRNVPPAETVSVGSGEVEINLNATLLTQGIITGDPFIVTNDIRCTGNLTGSDAVPSMFIGRSGAGNPTVHFTGMLTIDCPEIYANTGGGGGGQQHTFLGGITLLQDAQIWFTGSNGQDFVIESDITGAFDLTLLATSPNGMVRFTSAQTVPRNYTVLAGSGGIAISHAQALKTATSLEVLSGGEARFELTGVAEIDGSLLFRPGSTIRWTAVATALQLNGVGPHEWSCVMFDPSDARAFEIRLPTDTTAVEFNPAASPMPTPIWRITGDTTFQTANPSTTSIRPGQDASGGLPGGVSVMFVERGKTLTIDAPLILSMYRGDGEPTGAAGIATIAGTGRLVFTQQNGWTPPSSYGLAEFDINVSFAGASFPTSVLNVTGFTALKEARVENSSVDLTVNFTDCTVAGDFYAYTNIAGGTGNTVVRWTGTNEVTGDYYQRQPQSFPSGLHRTEFMNDSVTNVLGDFRPCNDKTGGSGGVLSPYSMDLFAGENAEISVGGDIFIRYAYHSSSYIFEPLNGTGYATLARLVMDPVATNAFYNFESGGVVVDFELRNNKGTPTTVYASDTSLGVNSILVSGDSLTLDLSTSSSEAYFGGLSATGLDATIVLPNDLDIYTWNWNYPDVPADHVFDLRGFSTVDTSNNTWFGVYPDGAADFWFDGATLPGLIDLFAYAMTEPVRFRDDFSTERIRAKAALGADVRFEGVATVTDLVTTNSAGAPGATLTVVGTLIITGELDLRQASSSNPSYDIRLVGTVEYRPRGAGMLRILDFGGPTAGMPDFTVRREAAAFVDDEAMYGVSLAVYPSVDAGDFLLRNESATIALQFILGAEVYFASVTTEQASTGPLTLDFNGQDLRTPEAVFHSTLGIVAPAGSSLIMEGTATLLGPDNTLPEVRHRASGGLTLLGDLQTEAYLQTYAPVGPFDPAGFDVTALGAVAILEGSVDLTGLIGVRFTADLFTVAGVDMNPGGAWFVDSTQAPTAALMELANSDASGSGDQGNATSATNGGGNVNWNFGLAVVSSVSGTSMGLGLGIGLGNQ